jgi:hypothetical protein
VDNLFSAFGAIYKHKWTSTFVNPQAIIAEKGYWLKAIEDLTQEQIIKALDISLKTLDWMPSCAEFRKLALGIPSLAEVQAILASGKREDCKHPLELEIYDTVGVGTSKYDVRRSEREERKLIAEKYDVLTKKILLGMEND